MRRAHSLMIDKDIRNRGCDPYGAAIDLRLSTTQSFIVCPHPA